MPHFLTRHCPACPGNPISAAEKWIARTSRAMTIIGLRLAICAGSALLLSGSGPKAPLPTIRSLGIIAALGDTCMFEDVPDVAFEWIKPPKASFLEISDWGIDDEVTNAIGKQLAPRYKIQSISIEHQNFDSWTYESLARRIRELPIPETPVDAYLLVLRDWRHDAIGNTDHQLGGLGLYRRDRRGGADHFGVFASYRLVLLNAINGNLIASRPALSPDGRLPWQSTSSSLWPSNTNDPGDAQKHELRADFLRLIGTTLPPTLRQLHINS
jgi:hypothetical protein